MHFLIDGHNLIGKMPGMALSDSQDELELIIRLKGWVAAAPNRQVTIYFDGGGLGGYSQRLSSKDIRVIFAPPDREADDLLITPISRLCNRRSFTVVTSDRRVINATAMSRIKVLKSEAFIQREGFDYREALKEEEKRPSPVEAEPEKDPNPVMSDSELKEWLDLFGPVPERKLPPPKKRKSRPAVPQKPKRKGILATPQDRENPELEDVDLDAWLALFGGEKTEASPNNKKSQDKSKKASSKKKAPPSKKQPENPYDLSDEDLRTWNNYFGKD